MQLIPVNSASQLQCLDDEQVFQGYLVGLRNQPYDPETHSYSFWHGWRNGQVDGGYAEMDAAQYQLVAELCEHYREQR
jgi:hypothetical protein